MSTTIDERVVEMRFDNKNFEKNVQTTMNTVDKLNQSLKLTGATKGLEDVDAATKKVNMSVLGGAVESVSMKFSALQIMATTALANITNTAVNAGKRMISALTIDPIKTGFSEYETKINAVQTIMSNTASKGKTIDDVTKVLNELNTYADKTIYNFAEMTRNIGTFTAAGVGLEESASAIQGIANLAAASGSTSQQASTAMYQLSQALSSGTVKLMDWNSVVNAGMGGAKFQEALKATAREQGIAVDDMIEKHGSFRESLTEGWITADVLNTTLQKFTTGGAKDYAQSMIEAGKWTQAEADALLKEAQAMEDAATKVKTFTQLWDTLKESAQSGWSQTWEIIVGDFEEAKETLTKFSQVIGEMIESSANARNEVLQGWKDAGGRADLIDSLFNIFEGVMSIVKPIKEAFNEIFPPLTVQQLVDFTSGLKELTAKFKLGETASENLKRTFKGLFAILDIGGQIVSAVFKAVGSLTGTVGDMGGGILGVTAKIGDWLVKLSEAIRKGDIFNKALQGIATAIKFVYGAAKNFLGGIVDVFSSFDGLFSGATKGISSSMEEIGSSLENCSLIKILQAVWKGAVAIATAIGTVLKTIGSKLGASLDGFSFERLLDILNTLISGGIGIGIMKLVMSIGDAFGGISEIVENVAGVFEELGGVLKAYQNDINVKALLKIAAAVAILVASLVVLSCIEQEKLYDSIIALAFVFAELIGALALISKASGNLKGALKTSTILIGIAASVLILAIALKTISSLKFSELAVGLIGIGTLVAMMVIVAKTLSSKGKSALKGATQMVIFAAAIKILASVCIDLSSLKWEELAKGLIGVGALMAGVALFMNNAKFSNKAITTATGMVIIAAAIKILASGCKDFASMSWEELGKGLASIGALLLSLAAFTKLTGNAKNVISTGVGLIAIAAAMKILASAMLDIANLSLGELAKGLLGVGGALAAVTLAVNFMPKNMIGIGVGLIAVATAIAILSSSVIKLGGMSWEDIAKGLVALGGSIAILAVGLKAMNGSLAGSAALVVATAAIMLLTPALLILGSMSWESIIKGLVSIAGAFAIIGIAGLLLQPIIPAILGLAGALALIGVGILAAGVGLVAAGAGISALAVGLTALASALVVSVAVIAEGIVSILLTIARGLGEIIVAICESIIASAPAIGKALIVLVKTCCEVLIECIPEIVTTLLKLIIALMDSLAEHTPAIVDALFKFVIGILQSFATNIPGLIQAVVDVLMAVFSGVVSALSSIDPTTLLQGVAAIGIMAALIVALSAITPFIPGAMAGVLGMGLVIAELALVLAAIGALAQIPGLKWLIEEGGELLQGIGNALGKFVGGIIGGIAEGVTSSLPQIGTDLSEFMTNAKPFIDGARSIDASVMDGVKSIAEVILLLTAANILEGLTSWFTGGSSLASFGEEIAAFGPYLKAFSDSVAGIVPENIKAASDAAKALAEMADTIPNEGGVAGWFAGENSVAKFGSELPKLGQGLKGFSDSVAGIVPENIVAAAEAAKTLTEMADTIPNEGGVAGWFAGENSIAAFGDNLINLGKGLKGFSDSVVGITPENITAAATAAKSIAEMASIIPNEGGMVAWFTGDNSIAKFAEKLPGLGKGLKGFSDSVAGISPANTTAAASAAKSLADTASNTPKDTSKLKSFGNNIATFGSKLKTYFESMSGVTEASISKSAQAITVIKECNDINTGGLSSASKAIDGIVKSLKGMASITEKTTVGFTKAMTKLGQTNVEALIKAFEYGYPKLEKVGQTSIEKISNGVESKSTTARAAFTDVIKSCVEAVKGVYQTFYSSGKYLVDGFAAGITANTYKAVAKAKAMAKAAASAARKELDINSPSRVGYGIGAYFGMGFVNALSDYVTDSYAGGTEIANAAKNGLGEAISKVNDFIGSSMDAQPTVRPILDLSDVKSGVRAMSGMLDVGSAVGISANVGAISTMMSQRNQNGESGEIVSAINKLRKELGEIKSETYSINGITYDDGSNIAEAVRSIVRAAKIERRV